MGAGMASIAAIEVQEEVAPLGAFYNYGSPRVGNPAFADYAEKTLGNIFVARAIHW